MDPDGNIIRRVLPEVAAIIGSNTSFSQIEAPFDDSDSLFRIKKIPFVSFYYEYPFPLLKDMALFYLDVLEDVLKQGYCLSDGTPFNCTYLGCKKFEFFDLGSIIPFEKNIGWPGYRQFLIDFYFPLVYLSDLKSVYPCALLPFVNENRWLSSVSFSFRQRMRLPNIIFTDFIRRSFKKSLQPEQNGNTTISVNSLAKVIALLRNAILHTTCKSTKTKWDNYYSHTILSQEYFAEKEEIFKKLFAQVSGRFSPDSIAVDWGANNGHFSAVMAAECRYLTVVGVESDHNAASQLYSLRNRSRIVPIHSSVFNPSPATGYENNRASLLNRLSKAELHVSLGLIHHMQHELNLSYEDIISFFHNHSKEKSFLIIEYVDPEDDRYRLIRNPNYPFPEGKDAFRAALTSKYSILDRSLPVDGREVLLAQKNA